MLSRERRCVGATIDQRSLTLRTRWEAFSPLSPCCFGARGPFMKWHDVLSIWRDWADDVRGGDRQRLITSRKRCQIRLLAALHAFFFVAGRAVTGFCCCFSPEGLKTAVTRRKTLSLPAHAPPLCAYGIRSAWIRRSKLDAGEKRQPRLWRLSMKMVAVPAARAFSRSLCRCALAQARSALLTCEPACRRAGRLCRKQHLQRAPGQKRKNWKSAPNKPSEACAAVLRVAALRERH